MAVIRYSATYQTQEKSCDMKHFFLFILALILCGAIALNHLSGDMSLSRNKIERVVNMTYIQSNEPVVEVDGIRFEFLMPERVFIVPEKPFEDHTPVELGVRITNNTSTPYHFSFYNAITPELMMPDTQTLRDMSYMSDWLVGPRESDFPLAMPGESVTFMSGATIVKDENDQFTFIISVGDGGMNYFTKLQLGTYQLRFKYTNDSVEPKVYEKISGKKKRIENIWTGEASMPFVEFSLVSCLR
jgi:hypothetical protein